MLYNVESGDSFLSTTHIFIGTATGDTGPTYDHTYGSADGRYMYVEASSPRVAGDIARLISRPYTQLETNGRSTECLTFYYHMFGDYMGTLNVYKVSGSEASGDNLGKPIWTKSGDQGNYWRIAQVLMTSTAVFHQVEQFHH